MVRGEGNGGAKEMSDVRRGCRVGLLGGEGAGMGWPPKKCEEPGLFVALLTGGAELWSLWTGPYPQSYVVRKDHEDKTWEDAPKFIWRRNNRAERYCTRHGLKKQMK